jgi:hypothetical protein
MGHIPVGGDGGTLQQLATLTKPRKMYIHINNSESMLNEAGAEYRTVRDAGWEWRKTDATSRCENGDRSIALDGRAAQCFAAGGRGTLSPSASLSSSDA